MYFCDVKETYEIVNSFDRRVIHVVQPSISRQQRNERIVVHFEIDRLPLFGKDLLDDLLVAFRLLQHSVHHVPEEVERRRSGISKEILVRLERFDERVNRFPSRIGGDLSRMLELFEEELRARVSLSYNSGMTENAQRKLREPFCFDDAFLPTKHVAAHSIPSPLS